MDGGINALLEIFPNLKHYLELVPICMVGLIAGVASYFGDGDEQRCLRRGIKAIITSTFLCVVTYSMLGMIEGIPYLAKVGVGATIGYFGIDKTIELLHKLKGVKSATQEVVKKE